MGMGLGTELLGMGMGRGTGTAGMATLHRTVVRTPLSTLLRTVLPTSPTVLEAPSFNSPRRACCSVSRLALAHSVLCSVPSWGAARSF
jgi:hypothetical protein